MCDSERETVDLRDHYAVMPIVATPKEAWHDRRYVGELNIYTDSPHPLSIEIPCPPTGIYSYTVNLVKKGPRED